MTICRWQVENLLFTYNRVVVLDRPRLPPSVLTRRLCDVFNLKPSSRAQFLVFFGDDGSWQVLNHKTWHSTLTCSSMRLQPINTVSTAVNLVLLLLLLLLLMRKGKLSRRTQRVLFGFSSEAFLGFVRSSSNCEHLSRGGGREELAVGMKCCMHLLLLLLLHNKLEKRLVK